MWHWVFFKEKTKAYIILKDEQVTGEVRWQLHNDGYEVLLDSALSYKSAAHEAKEHYHLEPLRYQIRPITFRNACTFINENHRHHTAPQGHKFSLALHDKEKVIGVIIAGRPVSRHQDDGLTLEITKCCVKEPYKNGISKLYSQVCQIASAMGFEHVITYTLTSEPGQSMQASNFELVRKSKGGSWNSHSRPRADKHPTSEKYLWQRVV